MQQRNGFTLLELIVVVLIIGILAAIAIPRFTSTKDRAYVAAMRSDLRNLVTAEENYFADYQTYSTSQGLLNFTASTGVAVSIGFADGTGWSATSKHNATSKTCGVYIGTAAPPIVGAQPGEALCQ